MSITEGLGEDFGLDGPILDLHVVEDGLEGESDGVRALATALPVFSGLWVVKACSVGGWLLGVAAECWGGVIRHHWAVSYLVGGHVVHGLAEERYEEQRLEQRVHVARRALVLEA